MGRLTYLIGRRFGERQHCPEHPSPGNGPAIFRGLPDHDVWIGRSWGLAWPRRLYYWFHNDKKLGRPLLEWCVKNLLRSRRTPGYGGTVWPDEFPQPRTCSFCGGVHPEDAIALVEKGWTLGDTTKGYKFYMEPPGYAENQRLWMEHNRSKKALPQPPKVASPVHPVKLYTYHLSPEHRARLVALLDAGKGQ